MLFRVYATCPLSIFINFKHLFLKQITKVVLGGEAYRNTTLRKDDIVLSVNKKFNPNQSDFVGFVELLVWRPPSKDFAILNESRC